MADRVGVDDDWGPAMQALRDDRERRFVLLLAEFGYSNMKRAHAEAGFTPHSSGVHKLAHTPRIILALTEVTKSMLSLGQGVASTTLQQLAADTTVAPSVRAACAKEIVHLAGHVAKTEHAITVKKEPTEVEYRAMIEQYSKALGLDSAKLIEGDYTELKALSAPKEAKKTIDLAPEQVHEEIDWNDLSEIGIFSDETK